MRLIQTLIDAINKITNITDKEDIEGAKIQLSDSYKLLGYEEKYFLSKNYYPFYEN